MLTNKLSFVNKFVQDVDNVDFLSYDDKVEFIKIIKEILFNGKN